MARTFQKAGSVCARINLVLGGLLAQPAAMMETADSLNRLGRKLRRPGLVTRRIGHADRHGRESSALLSDPAATTPLRESTRTARRRPTGHAQIVRHRIFLWRPVCVRNGTQIGGS